MVLYAIKQPEFAETTMIKSIVKSVLPKPLQKQLQRYRFGKFTVLQWDTDGLLPAEVYEEICNTFQNRIANDVIEIGGAGGSASIAICWGLKHANSPVKLIVVEKCEGGTRTKYGGFESNLERYWQAVEFHGVKDQIDLFTEYLTLENGAEVLKKVTTSKIGGLMIDADGHIHRDFALFWERLQPESPIVIDDYHESLSPKHALTYELLNKFIEWKLIRRRKIVGSTFFGVKGNENAFANFDWTECVEIATRVCDQWKVEFDRTGIQQIGTANQ